jgi:hypothetical protein
LKPLRTLRSTKKRPKHGEGCAWLEVDGEGAELDCPLGDSSSNILVPQDVAERVVGDDGDRVLLEVVS